MYPNLTGTSITMSGEITPLACIPTVVETVSKISFVTTDFVWHLWTSTSLENISTVANQKPLIIINVESEADSRKPLNHAFGSGMEGIPLVPSQTWS